MRRMLTCSSVLLLLLLSTPALSSFYNHPCETDAECVKLYNKNYECLDNGCIRKPFDFRWHYIIGFAIVILVSTVTNSGGVGAGTAIAPVYIFCFGFVASDALPLSRVTIVAGSFVTFLMNFSRRRPKNQNQLLINYPLVAVITPLILAGTQVGVVLSQLLPSGVVNILLICYLAFAAARMFRRARREMQQEELPLISVTAENVQELMTPKTLLQAEAPRKDTCKLYRKQWVNLLFVVFCFMLLVASSLLRGGRGRPSVAGINSCSATGWLILICTQIVSLAISFGILLWNRTEFHRSDHEELQSMSAEEHRDEIRRKLLLVGYLTGMLAGLLGVGGGMIIGLYMLDLGMDLTLTTAFSTFIVLYSSLATAFQFMLLGAIWMKHAGYFIIFSLIGSIIGNFGMKVIIEEYKKGSWLIWTLFFVLIFSALGISAETVLGTMHNIQNMITFGTPC